MEDFKFKCDHCGLKIEASPDQIGQKVVCPGCHQAIEIPKSPALRAAEAAQVTLPARTIPMAQDWEVPRQEEAPEAEQQPLKKTHDSSQQHHQVDDDSGRGQSSPNYKVIPITLSPEEDKTPASVARKVERTIAAFSVGGWRFLRIDAITYETKGTLGSTEEIVHLAIFTQD